MARTRKHKGPLHHLLKWFKPDANSTEKIPTMARDPSRIGKIPLKISITESREELINETDNAIEDIQIFTDSSALEGMVGAAVILTHQGRHIWTLHYHLGPDAKHTVHKAKMVGLLLGLHMLNSTKYRSLPAIIGIDNQAAIKALASDLRSPGHHLAREALHIASSIEKAKKRKARNKATLTIYWTAGHKGIEGNELADIEAKEVTKGRTLDTKQLPHYLRKPLPTNPSAVKKAHNNKLKREWQEDWKNSE